MLETLNQLNEFTLQPEFKEKLLNGHQSYGFICAIASGPYLLDPSHWLTYLWGGTEEAPFSASQLETFAQFSVLLWNDARFKLLDGSWEWPESYQLDDEEIIHQNVREFVDGFLQGWQLVKDDWENIIPQDSQDGALVGGVLLSITMIYDPHTALQTLQKEGIEGFDELKEIFFAMPKMLSGLTQRGDLWREMQEKQDETQE